MGQRRGGKEVGPRLHCVGRTARRPGLDSSLYGAPAVELARPSQPTESGRPCRTKEIRQLCLMLPYR